MMNRYGIAALLAFQGCAPAMAADYLTSVTSEVYQTSGTPREIAARASICIAQHLAPGTADAPLIMSSDPDNGMIVARSALEYGSLPRWKVRSRFTFEAREGRFRIEQTDIERFNDQFHVGWGPIGKWPGSQWKKAEEAFAASATAVAQCVMNDPKRETW